MLLATPLVCLALATCHDTLGPSPRLPAEPRALVTGEDTLVANGDTHISKTSPNQNFGGYDEMRVGGTSRYRALVQFDSAAIRQAVGAGQLDSARLEFTIIANPDGFGSGGRQVDLHRLTRSWTEGGATWHCPHDADLSNAAPDCEGTAWDMTNQGQAPYVTTRTARVTITNGQTGVIRLDVTQDVAAFLAGTVHQGWIFRKYNESEGGQALVLARHTAGAPRLILAVTADTGRPAVPNYGYYADSAFLATSPLDTNFVYFRRQLLVTFDDSTSGTTINNILQRYGATIVGGITLIQGYMLLFPDPGPGFTSLDSLRSALKAEPGVDLVSFTRYRSPPPEVDWLHPRDGLNLGRTEWSAPVSDTTWALRAIRAPLAWGCESGTGGAPPVRVGIIEWFFDHLHPDLAAASPTLRLGQSVPSAPLSGALADELLWHGTAVAGAMTAEGNNGIGIPGVLWRSDLRLYTLGTPSASPGEQRDAFLRDGLIPLTADSVQVVTLSMVIPSDRLDPDFVPTLASGIRVAFQQNSNMLVVKATGNDAGSFTEAQLQASGGNALTLALIQLRNEGEAGRVLLVTGSERGNNYWSGGTYLIGHTDIAAPAKAVALLGVPAAGSAWTGTGGVLLANGTSFAAPMVAGVAASLLSQDPSLTPAQVKALILTGAAMHKPPLGNLPGGASHIQELDAYGALRQLAEYGNGATPLCGNAVWVAGRQLKARRGNSVEVLATINDSAGLVNVLHGGRRVDVYADLSGKRSFLFNSTTRVWDEALNPYALPDTLPGGTFLGALWASHDGDSTVSVVPAPSGVPGAFEVRLRTGGLTTHTFAVSTSLSSSTGWGIVRQRFGADSAYHPIDSTLTGTTQSASARPAFSPTGRRLLVVLNKEQQQTSLGGTAPCQGDLSPYPDLCTSVVSVTATLPNEVWEIPLPPGSPHSLGTTGSTHLFWLGEAEDGGRLVSGTGVHQASSTIVQNSAGSWQLISDSNQWLNCMVEFRQTADLVLLNSELSAEACSPFEAAGSFAPLRAASRQ